MSGLLILLLILALILGGVGLFVEALWWLIIIAVVLALVGVISNVFNGSRRGPRV
jgi:hypothetical protein